MKREKWMFQWDLGDWIYFFFIVGQKILIYGGVILTVFLLGTVIAVAAAGAFQIWECIFDPLCRLE